MNLHSAIAQPPVGIRLSAPRGLAANANEISDDGGKFNAGLIPNVSVITRGLARGHGVWIDDVALEQVAGSEPARGLRSRFTHPGLSSDGMGKQVGRVFGLRMGADGSKVVGDLHINASARKHEDYGGKVLTWAKEDPEAFGMSIVAERDVDAMQEFYDAHLDGDGNFVSPDPQNTDNLPHVRFVGLNAADVVGDPAANPDGLFSAGNELPLSVERMLDYAFGLSSETPDVALGVNPERARLFVSDYLDRHNLRVARVDAEDQAAGIPPAKREEDVMELQSLTIEQLASGRPDIVDQLKKLGADESAAPVREAAFAEGRSEGVKVERERSSRIVSLARQLRIAGDDESVQQMLSDGTEIESAEVKLRDRRIAQLELSAPKSPGASADPDAANEATAAAKSGKYAEGMSADDAWERNVMLPGSQDSVQSEFSSKASFMAWAKHDQEGRRLLS